MFNIIDLSIIIPHYNSPKLLKKLLDSIPKDRGIEIIVIDDSSKIGNDYYNNELKNNIKYNHIQFIDNESSKNGAGVFRNIGLNISKGRWILFADSDDYFVEGFYESLEKYFDSNNDVIYFTPTSKELYGGNKSDRHVTYEKLILDYVNSGNLKTESYLRYKFYAPWSKLINRKLIVDNQIIFDETIVSNDVMFSTKIGFYMNKFTVSLDTIYCVTRSKGSLTTKIDQKNFDERFDVFIRQYKFLKNKLNKKEFEALNIHGIGFIIKAITDKLGVKTVVYTYIKLKKNKIKVLEWKLLNIKFIINGINKNIKYMKRIKRYIN